MNIRVFGLDHSTVVLHDIQMDVPFEATVEIPSEKALVSKDLWRAISSKQLFQLSKSPNQISMSTEPELREQIRQLTAENEDLRSKLLAKHAEVDGLKLQQATLDSILTRLSNVPTVHPTVTATVEGTPSGGAWRVVDNSAPMFIPTTIMPEGAESHIETTKTEADTGVSGAQNKLRQLKSKG
jgi:hypothetical protein